MIGQEVAAVGIAEADGTTGVQRILEKIGPGYVERDYYNEIYFISCPKIRAIDSHIYVKRRYAILEIS